MSLAPPTRPLPSSPSIRSSELSSRSGSTRVSPSRKNTGADRKSPARSSEDSVLDPNKRDHERSKALERVSGGQGNGNGKSAAGRSGNRNSVQGGSGGVHIQINDAPEPAPAEWGANFWVTIMDPMTQAVFYACPSTGQTSWEPPTETFLMPLDDSGHWWELSDDSRGGTPYYYHTKTGDTQWIRPEGFVIPLGIIQTTTALGRRLSQTTFGRTSVYRNSIASNISENRMPNNRRSRSYGDPGIGAGIPEEDLESLSGGRPRRGSSESSRSLTSPPLTKSAYVHGMHAEPLSTIPGSPEATSISGSKVSKSMHDASEPVSTDEGTPGRVGTPSPVRAATSPLSQVHSASELGTAGSQPLRGAAEALVYAAREEQQDIMRRPSSPLRRSSTPPVKTKGIRFPTDSPVQRAKDLAAAHPMSPKRPLPAPSDGLVSPRRPRHDTELSAASNASGKDIGSPKPDPEATYRMSPLKALSGKPILLQQDDPHIPLARLSTGDHKILPRPLAEDIQQFAVEDFAKRYFNTHRTGLIFKRRVPMEKMMSWQKGPLQAPLLVLNRTLHKDAVKAFKVIQRVMGDREKERSGGPKSPDLTASHASSSGIGKETYGIGSVLEEERWMLGEGLTHGELRDEIYCQVIKQLTGNPNPESIFHGWQLMCVLLATFPPSKNLEAYARKFMQEHLNDTEGRVDIMAKYCVSRLGVISKKGPKGKSPTVQEIEAAADAAFNPSTFGESLEAIMRLQQRTYPDSKVPIILPFLADSIIALGGTKREGIFRIPGDADTVSELKGRIDKGHYNMQGIDDPHVPASLLKMWFRELQEPVVPFEMYNDCVGSAEDPDEIIKIVKRMPTMNKRVLLFVISFLQCFLPDDISSATKMNSPNLALVMAPNLLRCNSDSLAIVFNNARFEHTFVHNLLLHLKCHKIDPDYVPTHGMGAGSGLKRPKSTVRRET
ncbi:hypothetical protein FRB93_001332 [Tulasnella sp. JGI-2019a]|nr:hypothetical protein FRB93_001332 [Tulasnella sp. JGI-2019a]